MNISLYIKNTHCNFSWVCSWGFHYYHGNITGLFSSSDKWLLVHHPTTEDFEEELAKSIDNHKQIDVLFFFLDFAVIKHLTP